MRFNFVTQRIPGKNLLVADMLSLNLSAVVSDKSTYLPFDDVQMHPNSIQSVSPVSDRTLPETAIETSKDPDLLLVLSYTLVGWPEYHKFTPDIFLQ